jgi:hypothetical protein
MVAALNFDAGSHSVGPALFTSFRGWIIALDPSLFPFYSLYHLFVKAASHVHSPLFYYNHIAQLIHVPFACSHDYKQIVKASLRSHSSFCHEHSVTNLADLCIWK